MYYIQHEDEETPRVLIDPNTLSDDGTTRVTGLTFNKAGTRIAYMLSQAGSDWQQIRVLEVATGDPLSDVIDWVKISGIAWHGEGFFYSRYPEPSNTEAAFSSMNEDHQVYFHTLGTAQSTDVRRIGDQRSRSGEGRERAARDGPWCTQRGLHPPLDHL